LFALIAGEQACVDSTTLQGMAGSLRRSVHPPQSWLDERGRAGFAAGVAGLLSEDVFDRQPWTDRDLVFAAHARIDNRDELLGELGIAAIDRSTLSDTEVLFRCYQRWQRDCVQRLVGDYVFAAWHRECGTLVAAVDHIGDSRLFYADAPGRLIASTQLAVVLAHPHVSDELNLTALGALCAPRSIRGATPYRAVSSLPGGHLLIRDRSGTRLTRWWQPDPSVRLRYRDSRDYIAGAAQLFQQSVQAQLRAAGPVAATLSGGLDSSLTTATAARLLAGAGKSLVAYTSVPEPGLPCVQRDGWDNSDFEYAASVARLHDNVEHIAVTPGKLCPLDLIPAIHAHSRTPVRNGANHLWFGRISRTAVDAGTRVVLTGQLGNIGISATGSGIVEELIGNREWLAAGRRALELSRVEQYPLWRSAAHALRASVGLNGRPHRTRRLPGTQFLNPQFQREIQAELDEAPAVLSPDAQRKTALTNFKLGWSVDPLVQWNVQFRDPTADRRLIEYLLSCPLEVFTTAGRHRGLARALGVGLIPEAVRVRRTRGSQSPEHPSMVAAHRDRYLKAVDALRGSPSCRDVFALEALTEGISDLARGTLDIAKAQSVDRALDAGLFIAAHEFRR
jgi:asparagine synthase (glutamine-hydrolysing)